MSVSDRLVKTLLKQTQVSLDNSDLKQAELHLKEALQIDETSIDREAAIRELLWQYSEQITDPKSPNWEEGHRALDLLESLGVHNHETRSWQRNLRLKQADFLLNNGSLDASFQIFNDLMKNTQNLPPVEETKDKISDIVRDNIAKRAAGHDWSFLQQVIQRVQRLWTSGDELYVWLETLRIALAEADRAGEQARNESLKLEQEISSKNKMILALTVIIVSAVVSYVIFTLWFIQNVS